MPVNFGSGLGSQVASMNGNDNGYLQQLLSGSMGHLPLPALKQAYNIAQQAAAYDQDVDLSGFMNAYVNPYMGSQNVELGNSIDNLLYNLAGNVGGEKYVGAFTNRLGQSNGGYIPGMIDRANMAANLAPMYSTNQNFMNALGGYGRTLGGDINRFATSQWNDIGGIFNQMQENFPNQNFGNLNLPGNMNGLPNIARNALQAIVNERNALTDTNNNRGKMSRAGGGLGRARSNYDPITGGGGSAGANWAVTDLGPVNDSIAKAYNGYVAALEQMINGGADFNTAWGSIQNNRNDVFKNLGAKGVNALKKRATGMSWKKKQFKP